MGDSIRVPETNPDFDHGSSGGFHSGKRKKKPKEEKTKHEKKRPVDSTKNDQDGSIDIIL